MVRSSFRVASITPDRWNSASHWPRKLQTTPSFFSLARTFGLCARAVGGEPPDSGIAGRQYLLQEHYIEASIASLREAVQLFSLHAQYISIEPDLAFVRAHSSYEKLLKEPQPKREEVEK